MVWYGAAWRGVAWCGVTTSPVAVMDGAGQVLLDKNLSLPRAMKKQDHVIEFRKITIGEKIAAGSNATVYKGMYLGVPVALKEIYYSVFDMQAVEHFRQEAAILGNLHHPHIVYVARGAKHRAVQCCAVLCGLYGVTRCIAPCAAAFSACATGRHTCTWSRS